MYEGLLLYVIEIVRDVEKKIVRRIGNRGPSTLKVISDWDPLVH